MNNKKNKFYFVNNFFMLRKSIYFVNNSQESYLQIKNKQTDKQKTNSGQRLKILENLI